MTSKHCIYFGEDTEKKEDDLPIYKCQLHELCIQSKSNAKFPGCENCKDKLQLEDSDFINKWIDPLILTDRKKNPTKVLRDLLAGRGAFLAGGGPSTDNQPIDELNGRGMWTMAINNMAGHHRFKPQAMVCSDPPSKFSYSVWLDPGIMKFIPTPKLSGGRSKIRRKCSDGMFESMKQRTHECPNVWGFNRCSWLTPDDNFFLEDGAMWGNHQKGVEKTKQPKTVCTMLLGIRLLRYLGARTIYLVGCDFKMSDGYGYSFGQGRTSNACNSNNNQFAIVGKWLGELESAGVFKRFGLEIFNTFEHSALRAFPYVPFCDAIEEVRDIVEEEPDLVGWYEKTNNREKKK